MMITVRGGTHVNFSSKLVKDSKNDTAGGQFGIVGIVEAVKVKIRLIGSDLDVAEADRYNLGV